MSPLTTHVSSADLRISHADLLLFVSLLPNCCGFCRYLLWPFKVCRWRLGSWATTPRVSIHLSTADGLVPASLMLTYSCICVYCRTTAVSVATCCGLSMFIDSSLAPELLCPLFRSIYLLLTALHLHLMLTYCCICVYCRPTLLCLSCGLLGFIDGILAPELLCPLFRNGGASCVAVATERYRQKRTAKNGTQRTSTDLGS